MAHIHSNLHSGGLCCCGEAKPHKAEFQGRASEIHHRHCTEEGAKIDRDKRYAGSHSYVDRPQTRIALSDLMRDVKSDSTEFIKRKRWIMGRFNWQEGFGA